MKRLELNNLTTVSEMYENLEMKKHYYVNITQIIITRIHVVYQTNK